MFPRVCHTFHFNFNQKLIKLTIEFLLVFLSMTFIHGIESEALNLSPNVMTAKSSSDAPFSSLNFELNKHDRIQSKYSHQTLWMKFSLRNSSSEQMVRIIYPDAISGTMQLFKIENGRPKLISTNGSSIPYKLRKTHFLQPHFKIELKALESIDFLIALSGKHHFNFKLMEVDEAYFYANDSAKDNILTFYLGAIITLSFFYFVVFLFLKEVIYLKYSAFTLSFMSLILTLQGKMDKLFSLSGFSFSEHLILFSTAALFFATVFTSEFLEVKTYAPKFRPLFLGLKLLMLCFFILVLISFKWSFLSYQVYVFGMFIDISIMLSLFLFLVFAIFLLRQNYLARFYLASWGFLFSSVFVWFLSNYQVLPSNSLTQNALIFASIGEMLILALALAYKMKLNNIEKNIALTKARDKDLYERLVRVLSHDIANSLSIILLICKKLKKKYQFESHHDLTDVEKILLNAENIAGIVKNARDQEVLNYHKKYQDFGEIDLCEAIETSLKMFEFKASDKNIKLEFLRADSLVGKKIRADRNSFINNILSNALSNAIKFSYNDSIVKVHLFEEDEKLILHIRDYGVGLTEELVKKVFFSSDLISKEGTLFEKGSGLGTKIMHEYIKLFQFDLSVESVPGHGTTIKIGFKSN